MDLVLFFLAFTIGFGLFMSTAFFLAKWMFPKLEEGEDFDFRSNPKRGISRPWISKNPYSFK